MTTNEYDLKLDAFELGYVTSLLVTYDDDDIPTNSVVRNILNKIAQIRGTMS